MKIDAFLTCLGYYGISTGASLSLEGVYNLSSGTTGVFYNLLYPTGSHFLNGRIYAPVIPLINVYGNNIINNNILSGVDGLKVGYTHTGNFSLLMDIEYSGCNRTTNQRAMVLASTADSPSGLNSGFMLGITESNRIYFNTSGYSRTLDKELSTRNYVYLSLAEQQYVTIGIYDLNDDTVYKQDIALLNNTLNTNNVYIGNFLLSNSSDPYTGFSGKINQVILFNDSLADTDISICANCALTTGFNTGTSIFSFLAEQLTGMYFSGVTDFAITGYTNVTGSIVAHDGSSIQIIYPSGMTGYFQTGSVAIPMFSGVTIQGARNTFAFLYDTNALNAFSTFSLYFDLMLSSGDTIELYSYPQSNTSIGQKIVGIDWPTGTGIFQLISNGLNETLGVDYNVVRNQISGETLEDILSYDSIIASSIVTSYSGYWNDISRLAMSGGGFFPSAPQYFENTTNFTGIVKITGLSGVCINNPFYPSFGYDLHMNGQKLISGMYYDVVKSGTSGFVVLLSGTKLPPLDIFGQFDPTGGGPIGIISVDDNELAFIPEFSGFRQIRVDVAQDGWVYGPFTGFSEQVWVNGVRQLRDLDYVKTLPCSLITGLFNPPNLDFVMYDSNVGDNATWNLVVPPTLSLSGAQPGLANLTATPTLINLNGYPSNVPCLEVWNSQLTNGGTTFSSFIYNGIYSYAQISLPYTGFIDTNGSGTGIILVRYRYNNTIGEFSTSSPVSVFDGS